MACASASVRQNELGNGRPGRPQEPQPAIGEAEDRPERRTVAMTRVERYVEECMFGVERRAKTDSLG